MSRKRALLPFVFAAVSMGAQKEALTDDMLTDKVKLKLAADTTVKGGALGIDVKNGVVTLTGNVDSEKQKVKAEKLARKVGGIRSVENQLKVVHK